MNVAIAIGMACLAAISLAAAVRWRRTVSRERAAPTTEGLASRACERCLLCNGPLPTQLVTRDEVIARVERRIELDSDAVAQLLAGPPSSTWVSLFRP